MKNYFFIQFLEKVDRTKDTLPTVNFVTKEVNFENIKISFIDCSGQKNAYQIWEAQVKKINGLVC